MASVYRAIAGQTVYDVCMAAYGTLEGYLRLCKDNAFTGGLNYVITGGEDFVYEPGVYNSLPGDITTKKSAVNNIQKVVGQSRQSVYDVLMLTYGRMEQLVELLADSGWNSMASVDANAKSFTFALDRIGNPQLMTVLRQRTTTGDYGTASLEEVSVVTITRAFSQGFRVLSFS